MTDVSYKIPPWAHQLEAIKKAQTLRDFALFFEMGAGKTSTMVNILRHHYVDRRALIRTLIICPIVVVSNWKKEFLEHSNIEENEIVLLLGSGKKRLEILKKLGKEPKIIITNFESLSIRGLPQELLSYMPEIVVIDESQRIKNIKAARTKVAIQLGDFANHRYILSGTPILNNPMDIYAQYRFLDKGETFGRNFFAFRNTYFYDKNAGMPTHKYFPDWRPLPGSFEAFNNLIYKKAMRVLKKDCLDLPPIVRKRVEVVMDKEQAAVYSTMKKDFVAYLNDKACVANMALTKALRLQQIVSGFFPETKDGGKQYFKTNPRLDALKELLSMLIPDHKVIVWVCFRENYQQIEDMFITNFGGEKNPNIGAAKLVGGMSDKDRQEACDNFQNDPRYRVMIANQTAGGVGVNLTAASYSIYYSRSFSLEADLQSEARNHRGGSEIHDKITRIDLIAPNTIDEIILNALQKKESMANNILAYRKEFCIDVS